MSTNLVPDQLSPEELEYVREIRRLTHEASIQRPLCIMAVFSAAALALLLMQFFHRFLGVSIQMLLFLSTLYIVGIGIAAWKWIFLPRQRRLLNERNKLTHNKYWQGIYAKLKRLNEFHRQYEETFYLAERIINHYVLDEPIREPDVPIPSN